MIFIVFADNPLLQFVENWNFLFKMFNNFSICVCYDYVIDIVIHDEVYKFVRIFHEFNFIEFQHFFNFFSSHVRWVWKII